MIRYVTMQIRGDRTMRRELEDKMKISVDAAAQKGRDIGMPDMANGPELLQEVLLLLLISGSSRQPLHCNHLPILQQSSVHLGIPPSADQIICAIPMPKEHKD